MVVIDATTLLLMLRPGTPVPNDASGVPIDRPKERIEYLVKRLNDAKIKIIIPTPALAEALIHAGAAASQQIVAHLQRYSVWILARPRPPVRALPRLPRLAMPDLSAPSPAVPRLPFRACIVCLLTRFSARVSQATSCDLSIECRSTVG
jgi:hypothetical protein